MTSDDGFIVIGIDPGSTKMGLSVFNIHLKTGEVELISSQTLYTPTRYNEYQALYPNLSGRYIRHKICRDFVTWALHEFKPHLVVSEDNFLRLRAANAFKSLIESVDHIKEAVYAYDPLLPFYLIEPALGKKAVGAPTKGGGKEAVMNAVCKLKGIETTVDRKSLDEHSADSVAIAYWGVQLFLDSHSWIIEEK